MEINTLRDITIQVSGRKIDAFIEGHLPQYTYEMNALLLTVRNVSRCFPLELIPAPVFLPSDKKTDADK